jgi:hypothetical protein
MRAYVIQRNWRSCFTSINYQIHADDLVSSQGPSDIS